MNQAVRVSCNDTQVMIHNFRPATEKLRLISNFWCHTDSRDFESSDTNESKYEKPFFLFCSALSSLEPIFFFKVADMAHKFVRLAKNVLRNSRGFILHLHINSFIEQKCCW